MTDILNKEESSAQPNETSVAVGRIQIGGSIGGNISIGNNNQADTN